MRIFCVLWRRARKRRRGSWLQVQGQRLSNGTTTCVIATVVHPAPQREQLDKKHLAFAALMYVIIPAVLRD